MIDARATARPATVPTLRTLLCAAGVAMLGLVSGLVSAPGPAAAMPPVATLPSEGTVDGDTVTELLFPDDALAGLETTTGLTYERTLSNTLRPETAARDAGLLLLRAQGGEPPVAGLTFRKGQTDRQLGEFPQRSGNPIIMVFAEQVARDMAESAGGSPFYIRSRIKQSFGTPARITASKETVDGVEVETRTLLIRPFAGDPNSPRMRGFGDLELTVTVSPQVPGWYLRMAAKAGTVYDLALDYEGRPQ